MFFFVWARLFLAHYHLNFFQHLLQLELELPVLCLPLVYASHVLQITANTTGDMMAVINGLLPFTDYNVRVFVRNGVSDEANIMETAGYSITVKTRESGRLLVISLVYSLSMFYASASFFETCWVKQCIKAVRPTK